MQVIKELYVIEDNDNYILYAPLRRIILTINRDVVAILLNIRHGNELPKDEKTLNVIDYMRTIGIIDADDSYPLNYNSLAEYKPTNVTFLPTSDCNLRCIYCYADSGKTSKYLPIHIAKAAIDFVFNNTKDRNVSKVQVGFLGGGEPLFSMGSRQ